MGFSLFFQVGSLTPKQIVDFCEHILAKHRGRGPQRVWNAALVSVANRDGVLYRDQLEAFRPYAPGGPKAAFDNLFIGSTFIPWGGAGNAYREGIADVAYRWKHLTLQRKIWEQINDLYSGTVWHPYIEYEMPLDYLTNRHTRLLFEAYMVQSLRDAAAVRPGGTVLWSPAFFTANPPDGMGGVLRTFFERVERFGGQPVGWVDVQDMRGRWWISVGDTQVADWVNIVRDSSGAYTGVNMEMFRTPQYAPISVSEFERRRAAYRRLGLREGFSWEARFWMGAHSDGEAPQRQEPLVMVAPTEWGAKVDYDAVTWRPWNVDKWVVHYGGGRQRGAYDGPEREREILRSWERYHMSKGWRGIAYNYAIGMSGAVYRCRGENHSAATSGDYEADGIPENQEARAVVFICGGDQKPTEAAKNAFKRLYQALGPGLPVIGHYWVRGRAYTACPGPHLDDWIRSGGYK